MASTVWTIQMKMTTGSTAPRMFTKLRDAGQGAEKSVAAAEKALKSFGVATAAALPQVRGLSAAIRGLTKAMNGLPTNMDAALGRTSMAFTRTAYAASALGQEVRITSRASASALGQVTSALTSVRMTANSTASAVRNIANAARSIPKNIRPGVGGGAGGGSGTSGTDAGLMGLTALGMGAGGILGKGVGGAMNVQDASTQIALGLAMSGGSFTAAQRNTTSFRHQAMMLSMMTAQDMPTTLGLIQSMSTSIKNPAQLAAMMPSVARVADVMYLGPHHTAFQESVPDMARLAHMFNAYQGPQMQTLADLTYRVGYSSPDRLSRMTTQFSGFAEDYYRAMSRKGDSPEMQAETIKQVLRLGILGDVAVGHGKWGAAYNRMLLDIANPTKPKYKGQIALGIRDKQGHLISGRAVDAQGRFTPMALIEYLSHKTDGMAPLQQISALSAGFNVNAVRSLSGAISPKALNYLSQVQTTMGKMDPLDVAQRALMEGGHGPTNLLSSNFGTLATVIGSSVLPELNHFTQALADSVGKLAIYFDAHPHAAKAAAIGLGVTAAAGAAAALAIGGYVAGGILHKIPGVGHLMVGMGHHLKPMGGARILGGAKNLLGFGVIDAAKGMGINGAFREIGMAASFMAHGLAPLHLGMGAITKVLFKLGLRAIPVVGEVLMLIDTLKFLGAHAKDIGKGIGIAAGWIVKHGIPMLLDAFKGLITGIFGFVWDIIKMGPAGWGKLFGGALDATRAGYDSQTSGTQSTHRAIPVHPAHASKIAHGATGGMLRAEGLAYVHRNELIVNDRLTRRLERLTAAHEHGGGVAQRTTRHEIVLRAETAIPSDRRTLRALAQEIADILGHDMAYDSRAGGATPQLSGHSHYAIAQGETA